MQGIIFERIGDPQDVLSCTHIQAPSNSQDQVLVRVRARPVQPADLAFIRGRYRIHPIFPQTADWKDAGGRTRR
jgi:NADPH:quinone reductase-like Zn-dependent oxidoreductase